MDLISLLLTPVLDVMDQAGAAKLQAPEQCHGDVSLWAPLLRLFGGGGMARLPPPGP